VLKLSVYTSLALIAFAFNSILCRLALRNEAIDPASFTSIRLISGAVTLITLSYFFTKTGDKFKRGNWLSAFFLFAYAICFSVAYVSLTAGTGALILFGSVQMTMIAAALFKGERPKVLEWIGLAIALGGLVYLVFPGLTSPPLFYSSLMAGAGVAWGFYTLRGRGSGDPLGDTTGNFVRAAPMAILLSIPLFARIHLSNQGILLAVLSGAIASGIGYTIWYAALKHHTATRAAILQLAVPVIAALGGVSFLSEQFTARLLISGIFILGGIAAVIFARTSR
jgi:drug/metabolite transporter (DMT)-like permease